MNIYIKFYDKISECQDRQIKGAILVMRYIYSHNPKNIKLLQSIFKLDDDTDQFILN